MGDGLLSVLGKPGAKQVQARYSSLTGAQLGAAIVELACAATEHAVVAETEQLRAAAAR